MKKQQRILKTLRNAVVLALVFVLSTEPILVAAQPQLENLHAQAVDLALQGGDRYLDSASQAVVQSAELLGYLNVIQATPIDQISESYISDVITRALSVAEQSSIALGAVDDVADGVEQIGGAFPAAIDVATEATVPDEMRADLIALGIPAEQVDQISAGASSLYSSRQAGMSAQVQADLLSFGFTQSQIDQIALAVSQRGLVNSTLDTRMAQFRSTQDELADTRSGMLALAVQMLGYQIAARQANGIAPRDVTDAELQELAQDELRLLVHAAHLNAMWGSNPSAEIGEGDWWFIEHYAGRAGERLQNLIVETQNRGLVAELFVIHQMKMLAVSARTGDADYAKAELDSLAGLLANRLNTTAYYEQRLSAGLVERLWSQLTTAEAVRGRVEWTIPQSVAKNAVLVSMGHLNATGVENLVTVFGQFEESNELNNTNGVLIVAGLSFFDQLTLDFVQSALSIIAATTPQNVMLWLEAILTGDTDNPALLAANVILSLIPVLGVLPDLASLAADPSIFVKALSIFGIIGSIGDLIALIPGLQGVGGASFVGDAVSAVVKGLFKHADTIFRAVLNGLKLADAFDVVVDLVKTVVRIVGNSLGNGLQAVINTITNIFTGTRNLWGDFVSFVRRAGADLLLRLGFDEGSALVGRILSLGVDLSDEALVAAKKVADDLVAAGIDLSDEAAGGLGKFANSMNADELQRFINKLGGVCGVGLKDNSVYKLAAPTPCDPDVLKKALANYNNNFTNLMKAGAQNILEAVGPESLADVVIKYGSDPSNLTDAAKLFGVLGDPAISKNVISTAFNAGSAIGNKGPEALRALSGWSDAPGNLLKNETIAKELAQRAGKDSKVLEALSKLKELTDMNSPEAKALIAIMAENSVNFSKFDSRFVLGKWDSFTSGYVQYVRVNGGQFYSSHPEVYSILTANFTEAKAGDILWAINKNALQGSISNGTPFVYSLEGIVNPAIERQAIQAVKAGDWNLVNSLLGNKPGRMQELETLFNSGYDFRNINVDPIQFFKQ